MPSAVHLSNERARAVLSPEPSAFEPSEVEGTIPGRFARIVARCGDRLAIDDGRKALTYAELDDATEGLAQALVDRFGSSSEPVALLYQHGAPFIVAQFAVIKAGKFHASLDAGLAPDRLSMLLRNLGTRLLLCDSHCEALATQLAAVLPAASVLNTETLETHAPPQPLATNLTSHSTAYIIYTSGSTGAPEGVVIPHRQVLETTRRACLSMHIGTDDRCSQISPLSSAAATSEVFPPLLSGGAVFPFAVKSDGVTNARALARWLREKRITMYVSVPVLFRLLAVSLGSVGLPDIRMVRLSGDRILATDIDVFKRHFPASCLLRLAYGSSECNTVTCCFLDHEYQAGARVPSGYAVPDTQVLIVDDDLEPLPPGEAGEIVVRSRFLADGYWGNPARTAERFRIDPEDAHVRTYLTRDLGYLEPDGCLVHLGRADARVKVYGKWVVLTDIEQALLAVPGVREAVVIARDDGPHGNVLVAYYTATGAEPPADAFAVATNGLPSEVLPKRFVRLAELPVTPSNKIDRRRLAATSLP